MSKNIYGASNIEALLNERLATKVGLTEAGVIDPNLLPASIIPYADKQLYYTGELNTLTNSQYWKVLEAVDLTLIHFELGQAPSGSGSTTVELLKNGNTGTPLISVSFSSGETLKTASTTLTLAQFDKVSLAITDVTNAYHGADLTISIKYRRSEV